MSPKAFNTRIQKRLKRFSESFGYTDYERIGGPDILEHPDYHQAALYKALGEDYYPRQILFVADTIYGKTDFEGKILLPTNTIEPARHGYRIENHDPDASSHLLNTFSHLGDLTIAYIQPVLSKI